MCSEMNDPELRLLSAADVPAVLALQAQCYGPEFLESAQAFRAKLEASAPHRCSWMAWRGSEPLAYLVSLPVCEQSLPALDAPSVSLPAVPRLLYLHDLAVAPAGRSLGLGRRLVAQVLERAQALGLTRLGLVAVQGSVPYWQAQGFAEPVALAEGLAQKLASFGADARWMERTVQGAARPI
ncbi:acetyltransferase (GNAT) family protein [Roseateles asaccharophilus]|uniref:Acetyltransferase (GNAT) family protein n=2 Tax=Roseateles asaccharophilus TaxID=582607 RepID=A0A4R6N9W0_9BURK|nr:acetyltransferase (GNAT) family protein [Roseateles asaccharophilus]